MVDVRVFDLGKDEIDDLVYLSLLYLEEFQKHHPNFFKIDKVDSLDTKRYFKSVMNSGDSEIIAAFDDKGVVIGYAILEVKNRPPFYKVSRIGHISTLMIDPKYRGEGVSEIILNESKKWFESKDLLYFAIETSSNNEMGIKFGEKQKIYPVMIEFLGSLKG